MSAATPSARANKKLVLVVIDAMKPAMLERAVATGRAPVLERIMQEGHYVANCAAAFPSVTPVCAASITTGTGPDRHHIPSMNWYHREEGRYVEYGSSFSASRQFGVVRSLTDTVYRMNFEHLNADTPTVFESLDDAGVRTAGTTYLIYRGRHEHEVAGDSALVKMITSTLFRRTVKGPRELFYADLYASQRTGCPSTLGRPGVRDQHTGCVGSYLEEHDLYDFMLFSLPDNDAYSHRNGPHAQVTSLAAADRQLERLAHSAGGIDEFLDTHAVIVCSDHSQTPIEERIRLEDALGDFELASPSPSRSLDPEIALSPAQRSAMLYVLDEERREQVMRRALDALDGVEGVDIALWRDGDSAALRSSRGELRFAPGGEISDLRGERWSIAGDPAAVLGAELRDGTLHTPDYPDVLTRAWQALACPTTGDIILSAAPLYEFVDWGGADHVGGGSHGSLHATDSDAALLWCGTGPDSDHHAQWTLRDIAPMVLDHFGISTGAGRDPQPSESDQPPKDGD